MTKCLILSVRVPFVVCLVVSVILFERVIKVAIQPVELGNDAQVERHLGVVIRRVIVPLSDRVKPFVYLRMNDLIAPVVVRLLREVLGEVGRVEVDRRHIK